MCDPELLYDLVLVDLKKDPDSTEVLPYFDEYIMAHRQREKALEMAAEDKRGVSTDDIIQSKGKKRANVGW